MKPLRVIMLAFIMVLLQMPVACAVPENIGGTCDRTEDCSGEMNQQPIGSICKQPTGKCECPFGQRACCESVVSTGYCATACPADCAEPADAGTDSGQGGSVPGCATAADCTEKPADARCGDVECINGGCRLTFRPIEKIASQIRGDCVSTYCDGQGATIVLPDQDEYNDGMECTFDTCDDLMMQNIPLPNGSPCPETGAGVCFDGECVECINAVAEICGDGFACDSLLCVPATCWQKKNDMIDSPLETGVDCGGQCYPCFNPQACKAGTDCADGVCSGGMCALPTHGDGIKNDNETGVDCGCINCAPCPNDHECKTWENCQSLVCWGGKCQAPKCNDGRQNGDESGIDCGDACNTSCP